MRDLKQSELLSPLRASSNQPCTLVYLIVLILQITGLSGCGSSVVHPVQIKIMQQVGGDLIAVCLTEDYIFLKKQYGSVQLSYKNNRLQRTESFSFPQFSKVVEGVPAPATRAFIPPPTSTSLEIPNSCAHKEAWISLKNQRSLSLIWHGKRLVITTDQWQWGRESRHRLTGLYDMAPVVTHTPMKSKLRHKTFARSLDTPPLPTYVLASKTGLWTWTQGLQPRREHLPPNVPLPLLSVSRDGGVWWLSSPHADGSLVWPLSLFKGPAHLVGEPYIRHSSKQVLLAPLSGRALKGERHSLILKWGQHQLATAPLKSLCVLSARALVVATTEDIRVLYGPPIIPRQQGALAPHHHQPLKVIYQLKLPSSTHRVICESGWLSMLGDDYGLLRAKVKFFSDADG